MGTKNEARHFTNFSILIFSFYADFISCKNCPWRLAIVLLCNFWILYAKQSNVISVLTLAVPLVKILRNPIYYIQGIRRETEIPTQPVYGDGRSKTWGSYNVCHPRRRIARHPLGHSSQPTDSQASVWRYWIGEESQAPVNQSIILSWVKLY